jgi:tripartite-type tricarboxylate transporter receptor subunit TctC
MASPSRWSRAARISRTSHGAPRFFNGRGATNDLFGGQAQLQFAGTPESTGHIRAGTLRALAVTTATRSDALPDIPTVGEFVPGYEAAYWSGIGAPKNTPAEIIDKLNREINAGLADTKIKARLADKGATPLAGSPADFAKLIAEETEKWAKVIQAANIKPECLPMLTCNACMRGRFAFPPD